jgi:hypothetical protein
MDRTATPRGRSALLALSLLGLPFLAPGAARANGTNQLRDYTLRPIARPGQMAGDVLLPSPSGGRFTLGPLNERGEFVFSIGPSIQRAVGAYASALGNRSELLMKYGRGKFTPILVPETAGPVGTWPADLSLMWSFGMNQAGNVVFTAARSGGSNILGTFVWDAAMAQTHAIAARGMPVVNGWKFTQSGGFAPSINSNNEVAFVGIVRDATGPTGAGLFYRGVDGKLVPAFLPGQPLADGSKALISQFARPSLSDAGQIAFLAQRQGDRENGAYIWENGTINPLLRVNADVPSSGAISMVSGVFLHPRNGTALVSAAVNGSRQQGLYRVAGSTLTPLAEPGKEMPGGGKFKSLQNVILAPTSDTICLGVSPASRSGEHVILATLEDNSTAAYRVDTRGKLSLVLKSGMTTPQGTVTRVGMDSPASINSVGQIAVSVEFDGTGIPSVVLLSFNT